MKLYAKIINIWKVLIIFAKSSISDICLGSQYTSGFDVNVTNFKKSILTPMVQIFAISLKREYICEKSEDHSLGLF